MQDNIWFTNCTLNLARLPVSLNIISAILCYFLPQGDRLSHNKNKLMIIIVDVVVRKSI